MDFTFNQYLKLLNSLKNAGFIFQTFSNFIKSLNPVDENNNHKLIVLRHDVDRLPENSLHFAQFQNRFGITGTYYFRTGFESWDEGIIRKIAVLGHEIGYHYENLTSCNGNLVRAYNNFIVNLERFRALTTVTTICMHGSPRSPWDNKDLWKEYDYKILGILAEPYLDLDFNDVFYLTDTGRCWDGWRVRLRDKVPQQNEWKKKGWVYHSTQDIINAIENDRLPYPLMMTFHPQRWTNRPIPWLKEYLSQSIKNKVKRFLVNVNNSTHENSTDEKPIHDSR